MNIVTRFAPSPTGHVHIGNMRSAIYSWLFARHHDGAFLLRIEDTDRQRSTPEAVRTVLDAMQWLGLDHDGEVEYQSKYAAEHLSAAEAMVAQGLAYRVRREQGGTAVVFRIPWSSENIEYVREAGEIERPLHPERPVEIGNSVSLAFINRKGKPSLEEACLAGFKHMILLNAAGKTIFSLDEHIDEILAGSSVSVPGACAMRFLRREVFYKDLVKGDMSKPLDGMKDIVLVRADKTPVFHLANVRDDARQGITHIIRGDDHVENTFRHILLFKALGARVPEYAHLPMVVNAQGKPYSKRDGDAFVGDFRKQGYLADALFNYLALLGWSPGDDRELVSREEMIRLFDIGKIGSAPAQVNLKKLLWLNGAYMAAMPRDRYEKMAETVLRQEGLLNDPVNRDYFRSVLAVMADRIKLTGDFSRMAGFFFTEKYPYDEKAVKKRLRAPGVRENLLAVKASFQVMKTFNSKDLESGVLALAESRGIRPAELIHPLRVSVSGLMEGPGLYDMLELLGRDRVCRRIDRTLDLIVT